jgi:CheY-like chemotaxis protein
MEQSKLKSPAFGQGGARENFAMAGESILLVDDNDTNARLAEVVLERAGYRVRCALDVPQARERVAEEKPQMILMDVQLPKIDGLTYTRELKANEATRDILVVALTAYAMKGDDEKAIAAGCDGYLTKPISTRTFAETVAVFFKR